MNARTPPPLPAAEVESAVRVLLRDDRARLGTFECVPLGHRILSGTTTRLQRVTGTAIAAGVERTWSVVAKEVSPPDVPGSEMYLDPAFPGYWRREALVYRSALLDTLPPGLTAPRYLAATEQANTIRLFIEYLSEADGSWTPNRYAQAARALAMFGARHLGATDGAFDDPAVLHPGTAPLVRANLEAAVGRLGTAEDWADPRVRNAVGPRVHMRLNELVGRIPDMLEAIEGGQWTVCHFDASRPNLVAVSSELTGLLDWSVCGHGALGEDLSPLVWGSVQQFCVPASKARELQEATFDSYLQGLDDGGWAGDGESIRRVYTAASVVPWVFMTAGSLLGLLREDPSILSELHRMPEATVEEHIAMRSIVLDELFALGDEFARSARP